METNTIDPLSIGTAAIPRSYSKVPGYEQSQPARVFTSKEQAMAYAFALKRSGASHMTRTGKRTISIAGGRHELWVTVGFQRENTQVTL